MSLKEYNRKRDFRSTPEPAGGVAAEMGDRFVIHKHDATNLHYDLRLEIDGALASWAVPKGPSLDPSDKRLAVHVEDHPLEYGDFEGTIPEGQYGGGTVMLWDDGSWEPEGDPVKALKKGKLSFTLHGSKLRGGWTLTRIRGGKRGGDDKDNWLLIKHDDEYASRDGTVLDQEESVKTGRSLDEIAGVGKNGKAAAKGSSKKSRSTRKKKAGGKTPGPPKGAARKAMPEVVKPQLCTLTDRAPTGDEWIHEIKFDGYRLIARRQNGDVRLLTRNGHDWTHRFGPIAEAIGELGVDELILDGEASIVERDGRTSFQRLQQAIKAGEFERLAFHAFDLLYLNGYDLMERPLLERKELLESLLESVQGSVLRYSDHTVGGGERVYSHACDLRLEGIISKRADAPYSQCRSESWLKVKCIRRQEFVIIGYSEPSGARKHFGSLLLGAHDGEGRLVYTGRVGTGFSHALLEEIGGKLASSTRKTCPADGEPGPAERRGVTWVAPRLVAEVEFTEWTQEGRLRHPSFQGLRSDKPAEEITFETPKPLEATGAESDSVNKGGSGMSKGGKIVAKAGKKGEAEVLGVRISSPERLVFPDAGITKLELAEYYAAVAERMLPYIEHRPLSTVRCPQGRSKDCFYQKHMGSTFSDPIRAIPVEEKAGGAEFIGVDSAEGLVTLIQFGVIEIHPWGATEKNLDAPDLLTFDLDPGEGVEWAALAPAALRVRELLEESGLTSFLKLTGGKGLHVVVPLKPHKGDPGWDDAKAFCKAIAKAMERESSEEYIATASKAKRRGKIFVDYLRNGRGATSVAPFSARARAGAPVAAPLRWDELGKIESGDQYTIETLARRLSQLKDDPWEEYATIRQRLTRARMRWSAGDAAWVMDSVHSRESRAFSEISCGIHGMFNTGSEDIRALVLGAFPTHPRTRNNMMLSQSTESLPEESEGSSGSPVSNEQPITIVANRLPVKRGEGGDWEISPGGLVSALTPIVRKSSGTWMGWSGELDGRGGPFEFDGLKLIDLPMSEADFEEYYCQFANQVLWPLFHDGVRHPPFTESGWEGYRRVNQRFADAVASITPPGGSVWVQDYHLLLLPGMLRAQRADITIGLFLHIPLPPGELFATIPWRDALVESLSKADLIGTQTPLDAEHLRAILNDPSIHHEEDEDRPEPAVVIDAFPISIESAKFRKAAMEANVSGEVDLLRLKLGDDRSVYLGVDRLDYTKGIDLRLKAFEQALDEGALNPDEVCFVQVAVPSREQVPFYQEISEEVDRLVGRINGRYGKIGRPVVHYRKESVDFDDLVLLYRAADIMVVTPVRDGMNLVAKEYVATRYDHTGELILSEFAGAAQELTSATIVNPHDQRGLADAMAGAHARRKAGNGGAAMEAMHEQVMEHGVHRWAKSFTDRLSGLAASGSAGRPARRMTL